MDGLQRRRAGLLVLAGVLGMCVSFAQHGGKPPAEMPTIRVSTNVELVLPQKWYNEIWAPFVKDSYTVTVRTKDGKQSQLADVKNTVIKELKTARGMQNAYTEAKKAHDVIYQEDNFEAYENRERKSF